MKRFLVTIVLLNLTVFRLTPVYATTNGVMDKKAEPFFENNVQQESTSESYKNMVLALIYPYVEKAIEDYYSEYMKYPPREDIFSYQILSINKNNNYSYTIKLQVQPFVGPHNSVGLDYITLIIDTNGVTTEKYEHIKNYELPPNYQDIFKKKLPNN